MSDSSNTYLFGTNTEIDDLIKESFERIGIIGNEFTGLQIQSAILSANLELTSWTGKIPLSFMRKKGMFPVYPGQSTYDLPENISSIVDVVAIQPQILTNGSLGTAFSNGTVLSGSPQDAFTTGNTVQVKIEVDGNNCDIGYAFADYTQVSYVGVQTYNPESYYELEFQYSTNSSSGPWNTLLISDKPYTYFNNNELYWFVFQNPVSAKYWRVLNTSNNNLSIQNVYFAQPTNTGTGDRWLTALSYTEWMQISTKMSNGTPSSYFFNAQITPSITLWPIPSQQSNNSNYKAILYTGYQYVQDVNVLFDTFDVPQRFYDALVAGIAYRLAVKFAPDRIPIMKADYQDAFNAACRTDGEVVTLRFQPDFSVYGGGY